MQTSAQSAVRSAISWMLIAGYLGERQHVPVRGGPLTLKITDTYQRSAWANQLGAVTDLLERVTPRWHRGTQSRELKGNIFRAMLPFISGHGRSRGVRGTPCRELRGHTAAIEKRCRHRFGAPVFLAPATTRRWAGSLAIASHAGREVLRSGRGCWRGDFVSDGAEAQLRAPTFSVAKGKGLGAPAAEFSPQCGENWGSAQQGSAVAEIPVTWPLLARAGPPSPPFKTR